MKYIIVHGSFGSPKKNWFPALADRLTAYGQEVIVPQFPVNTWEEVTANGPDAALTKQSLSNWLTAFKPIAASIEPGEKICIVGHSLGPVFILHAVTEYSLQLDSAIFVSPFLEKLSRMWQIDLANDTFHKTDFDFGLLKKRIPVSYVIYSDDDPYVDSKYSKEFARLLGSSQLQVIGGKHFNSDVPMNVFPLVENLCLSRIPLPVYNAA